MSFIMLKILPQKLMTHVMELDELIFGTRNGSNTFEVGQRINHLAGKKYQIF